MLTLGRQLRTCAGRGQIGNDVNDLLYMMKNQYFGDVMRLDQGCAAFWYIGTRAGRHINERCRIAQRVNDAGVWLLGLFGWNGLRFSRHSRSTGEIFKTGARA